MDKQGLFKYKLTDDDDVFFIDDEEIKRTCISISEIEKMTEEQKENNTKSIIMDGATWVAVTNFGETVISGDDTNDNFVKSVRNAGAYIIKDNAGTTDVMDSDLINFHSRLMTVKNKNKKESRKNHFYDKQGRRLVFKEDSKMANNINLGGGEINFSEEELKNLGGGFEIPVDNGATSSNFANLEQSNRASELTVEDDGLGIGTDDAVYTRNHSRILAYLTPKDSESTIRLKKTVKTTKDENGNSIIVLNDKATELDRKFQEWQKNKGIDENAKAPQIEDNNGKMRSMKITDVTSEAKEYVYEIKGAQVRPSISHYIIQMPAQLADISMEDFSRIQDGTANLNREETDTIIKILNAQNFKIFLLSIGGSIDEEKSPVIPEPGSLTITEGKRMKDGKEVRTYSIKFNKYTIANTVRMYKGENVIAAVRKSVLTPENYLPLKRSETVVLSDTMSDEDHAKAKETIANLFAKYSQQSAGPEKLANLSAKASELLKKDDKGRYYFPLLENKRDIPELLDELGGKNWFNGDPITEFDLGTLIKKDKGDGTHTFSKVWYQTAPAKLTREKEENSALSLAKFRGIVSFLPEVMNFEKIREATTRTTSSTGDRARKSAESIYSRMKNATKTSTENRIGDLIRNVKSAAGEKVNVAGFMMDKDLLTKNDDMLRKSFNRKERA